MWKAVGEILVAFFKALFGIKTKDYETKEAEDNEAKAQHAESIFAAPDRDRATIDNILLQHANDK